jgi:polysaccharide chain length determinant protein (PEP-CTERM system associated)
MQPTQDLLSVTRRPLDVEDYIDILRRHKSWIAGPAFAALVLAVVVAFFWPDTYVSEATVQVVPPQVPERYVPSNVNSEMTQRINSMAQNILSRSTLVNIIQTDNLYRNELARKPMEDVLDAMRKNIKIGAVSSLETGQQQVAPKGPVSAFGVSFEYSNRYLAQKVTKELVTRFIDANIRALSSQSLATTDFLQDQWLETKKRLEELENRLTEFRLKNAGRLPDELQANLQALHSLETQLTGVNDTISRIGQEKLLLDSQVRVYKDQLAALRQGGDQFAQTVKNEQLAQTEREIVTSEASLANLKQRYTETHPDVQSAEAQLALLKQRRDALIKEEEQAKPASTPKKPSQLEARGSQEIEAGIARVQSELQARNMELAERTKSQNQLVAMLNQYNARIQSSPLIDRDYEQLTRDYSLARARYDELNAKKSQSEAATNLENRGQGERLELLDDASLPERPTKPIRILIIGAGFALGLMLGIVTAAAREMKDASLKSLKDARAYTKLPVLGTVPLLENDLVVRRKRRLAWLAWSAASVFGILAMTGSVYYYYSNKS